MRSQRVTADEFLPARGLRNRHVQSFVNSSGYRRLIVGRRARAMFAAERAWIVDGGGGVRLLGHYSPQAGSSRGLAVLFHGWEGSSRSNYVVAAGARLYNRGFDVFRLNFRDHGESHHLNPGIFHSCLLDEVVNALADVQRRTGASRWLLTGYSLGGNFALRVGLSSARAGLDIGSIVSVCPVVSPANVLRSMEQGLPVYERYFISKWTKSLQAKRVYFPDAYAYDEWRQLSGLREKTRFLATRYYEFDSLEAYFDGYSIAGERLAPLRVPTTILTSEDDPVVPVDDFRALVDNDNIELLVSRYGGHCAFLKNWKMESWADELIADRSEKMESGAGDGNRTHVISLGS